MLFPPPSSAWRWISSPLTSSKEAFLQADGPDAVSLCVTEQSGTIWTLSKWWGKWAPAVQIPVGPSNPFEAHLETQSSASCTCAYYQHAHIWRLCPLHKFRQRHLARGKRAFKLYPSNLCLFLFLSCLQNQNLAEHSSRYVHAHKFRATTRTYAVMLSKDHLLVLGCRFFPLH